MIILRMLAFAVNENKRHFKFIVTDLFCQIEKTFINLHPLWVVRYLLEGKAGDIETGFLGG